MKKSQKINFLCAESGLYLFLFVVFAMATPFEPQFSIHGWMDLSDSAAAIESGSLSRQSALIALAIFAIISLFLGSRNRLQINGMLGYIVVFFLFLSALSIFYSDNPMFTTKRVVVLLILSLGAFAVAIRLTLRKIMLLALCAGIFSVGFGFLCEIVLGTFRPFDSSYRFTGVLGPNFQASNCSMMLIAAVALSYLEKCNRTKCFYLAIVFLALLFLLLTKSRGGMIGTTVGLFAYFCFVSPRKTIFWLIFSVCLLIVGYLIAGEQLGVYTERLFTLGRTDFGDTGENLTTLTGRTDLWTTTVFSATQEHLLLGYGYDSFWSASRLMAQGPYELGSTHNGYLHILLGLGLTGMTTYVLIRILGIITYLRLLKRSGDAEYAFAFALLVSFSLFLITLDIQLIPHLATFVDMTLLARITLVDQ